MGPLVVIAISFINLMLGFLTWLKGGKRKINVLFFWLTVCVVIWAGSNYLADYYVDIHNDVVTSLIYTRLAFASSSLIAGVFLCFTLLFVNIKSKYLNLILFLVIISSFIIAVWTIFSSSVVSAVEIQGTTVSVVNGGLYYIYAAHLLAVFGAAFGISLIKYRSSKGLERARIQYLFLGTFLSVIFATFTNLFLPIMDDTIRSSRYGPYFTIFFVGFAAYAIVAYRLFDIRVIIKRTIVYSALLAFVLITYGLVVLSFTQVFGGNATFGFKELVPNMIAAILIAFGFDPLRKWLQNITDQYLFKGEYNPQEVAASLAKDLSNSVNLDEALDSMMMVIRDEMRVSRVAALVIREIDKENVVARVKSSGFANNQGLGSYATDALISHFDKNQKIIVVDELRQMIGIGSQDLGQLNKVIDQLDRFQSSVALPLIINGKTIGIMMAGEKLSGDNFTTQDLGMLDLIGSQSALSIEKARFYEEDKLKSEFISIASHELLTPTAAVEGYLSMLLDNKMKLTSAQKRQYTQRAYDSSRRLAELVKDLLSVSRIESGKIKVVPTEIDLLQIIDQNVEELRGLANSKTLKLDLVKPTVAIPKVYADPDRVSQVIINLLSNAIKYTLKGGIKIEIEQKNNLVYTRVEDTGIGIAEDDQQFLFEKFHRIDSPATAQIMGTGLGLYIVKNIVTLLGGEVGVESTPGKGSVFSFSLPVAK